MRSAVRPEGFRYTSRPATAAEVQSIGWIVDGPQAQSPSTGAWYDLGSFRVTASATIDGVEYFGRFLHLDDPLPMAERLIVEMS